VWLGFSKTLFTETEVGQIWHMSHSLPLLESKKEVYERQIWGGGEGGGRLQFEADPGKKFTRPHLNQWLDMVVHACYFSYAEKT
jgi:hypothetical protein